jgi:hypothetical protein
MITRKRLNSKLPSKSWKFTFGIWRPWHDAKAMSLTYKPRHW